MLAYSDENWQGCLEALGFTERKNPNGQDCYDVFNVGGIPSWQYCGMEQKILLYYFLSGIAYARLP